MQILRLGSASNKHAVQNPMNKTNVGFGMNMNKLGIMTRMLEADEKYSSNPVFATLKQVMEKLSQRKNDGLVFNLKTHPQDYSTGLVNYEISRVGSQQGLRGLIDITHPDFIDVLSKDSEELGEIIDARNAARAKRTRSVNPSAANIYA